LRLTGNDLYYDSISHMRGRFAVAEVDDATIADFGAQWTRFTDNGGYYGSVELLADIVEPLLPVSTIKGLRVVDIGSGTGRIVAMLIAAGAERVTAVEPSAAFQVLCENTRQWAERIDYANVPGDQLPMGEYDLAVSIGVLHHVYDPAPIVRRAYAALKPGGTMLVWLYGYEGNRLYLAFANTLRCVTRKLPDRVLEGLCHGLNVALGAYVAACRVLPLPMRSYMRGHIAKLSWNKRFLTIFDQLNPAYAKYYTREEAHRLLAEQGFRDVTLHHRHGYSWTVCGRKE
jgi:SAM-dependent methyltransferase